MVEWGEKQGDLEEASVKLSELLVLLRDTTKDFSHCNLQLRGMTQRLDRFLENLRESHQEKHKKKKKSHRGKKKQEPATTHDPHFMQTFRLICQELDEISSHMVQMYCTTPPDEMVSNQIFCLSSDTFVLQHVFSAPRLEVPDLLLHVEAHPPYSPIPSPTSLTCVIQGGQ